MEEAALAYLRSLPRPAKPHGAVTAVEITGESCPYQSSQVNQALLTPWMEAYRKGLKVRIYAAVFAHPVPRPCPGPWWQVEKSSVKEIWGVEGGPPKIVCGHIVHVD